MVIQIKNKPTKLSNPNFTIGNNLWDFSKQMQDILDNKSIKYADTWLNVDIDYLRWKLHQHLITINHNDKERAKRKLLHIANYCFLIYQRIKEEK